MLSAYAVFLCVDESGAERMIDLDFMFDRDEIPSNRFQSYQFQN